jgi:hypothetical protein
MDEKLIAYIAKLEAQVRDWDLRIDDLEMKAYREKVEGKLHIYREIGAMRRRQEETRRKIAELQQALELTAEPVSV